MAEGPLNHLFRLFIPHAVPKDLNTLPADYATTRNSSRPFVGASMSYDDVINSGVLVVGSPQTVARRLAEQAEETGTGHFLVLDELRQLDSAASLAFGRTVRTRSYSAVA